MTGIPAEKMGKLPTGGSIYVSGDFVNQSKGKVFVTDAGKVIFNGSETQQIAGDSSIAFFKVDVDKPAGEITLAQHVQVRDTLTLMGGNIWLNNQVLDLGSTGFLLGETPDKRVYGESGFLSVNRFINNADFAENLGGIGLGRV